MTKTSVFIASMLALILTLPLAAAPFALLQPGASSLSFQPQTDYYSVTLTVRGPKDLLVQRTFTAGQTPAFDLFDRAGNPLPDGSYTYELQFRPNVDAQAKAALEAARQRGDDSVAQQLRNQGRLPQEPMVQSGAFAIDGGALVTEGAQEREAGAQGSRQTVAAKAASDGPSILTEADQVIADDLIVQGSICVGFDCVNGESFGFDTIRLKENNTRIKFEDTSTGTFPTTDWQLTANDSASGGASKFSIDEVDGGRTPFTIRAGAPSNSMFVDSSGRLGLGTSTPVVNAHVVTGNTPTLRLEQNGSSGFTPQTWDVAGNEANFFVRDVTGGSKLSFRIQPGAPTSSLYVASSGNVGVGTSSPDAKLDIEGTAPFGFRLTDGATAFWDTKISGSGYAVSKDTNQAWLLIFDDGRVRLGPGPSGTETFFLQTNGNLKIAGTLTQNSDVHSKQGFAPVNGSDVLSKVMALPITTWSFKSDTPQVRHMGPMAQDFHSAFGLGEYDNALAPVDVDGVALAAIQELNRRLEAKDAELQDLRQQVSELDAVKARLAAIEALLTQQQP